MKVTKRAYLLTFLALLSCGRLSDAMTRMSGSQSATCASREQIIDTIGKAAISGETDSLRALTATADDLVRLQNEHGTPNKENRTALTRQMADDVVNAVKRFRTDSKPSRVMRTAAGEFREHAPIENIAPEADQVRDVRIVFETPGGEKSLTIGVLVRVGRCWKILYV